MTVYEQLQSRLANPPIEFVGDEYCAYCKLDLGSERVVQARGEYYCSDCEPIVRAEQAARCGCDQPCDCVLILTEMCGWWRCRCDH